MSLHQNPLDSYLQRTRDLSESPTEYLERTAGMNYDSREPDLNGVEELIRDYESRIKKKK